MQRIETALASTWETMYQEAALYHKAHGDLRMSKHYRTESGLPLGMWVYTQRRVYQGKLYGALSAERVARLEALGIEWEDINQKRWEEGFYHAAAYAEAHKNLNVPAAYICADGYRLGDWIGNQRARMKGKGGTRALTQEQIDRLNAVGMIWSQVDYVFDRGLQAAKEYAEEHGNLWVPVNYTTEDGFKLGAWISAQRTAYARRASSMTPERIRALEGAGIQWETKYDRDWREAFNEVSGYLKEHRDLKVPSAYVQNGVNLTRWMYQQRDVLSRGKMSGERLAALSSLGQPWQDWLAAHAKRGKLQ